MREESLNTGLVSVDNYCATMNFKSFLSGGSSDYAFPKKVAFESKVETDLYEFCKNKTSVLNMTINHTGDKVVMTGGDRKIRIFRILTGGTSKGFL